MDNPPTQAVEVEVCFAATGGVERIVVAVAPQSTIRAAITASGLLAVHAIDLQNTRVGVYGKLRQLDSLVAAGDRIEIYRPLKADPNETRLRRWRETRATKAGDLARPLKKGVRTS